MVFAMTFLHKNGEHWAERLLYFLYTIHGIAPQHIYHKQYADSAQHVWSDFIWHSAIPTLAAMMQVAFGGQAAWLQILTPPPYE